MAKSPAFDRNAVLGSESEAKRVLMILFIPSRDSDGNNLPRGEDQQQWADAAGRLLSEQFGGATQMPPAQGKWLNPETEEVISEDVILIHTYASTEDIEDRDKMECLATFLHRMGRRTKQGEVAVLIDEVFHRIRRFRRTEGSR